MILGDVCTVTMGQAPSGESYKITGEGIPLIAGASDLGRVYPAPSRSTISPSKLCKPGDIILCIRATIGNKNWADAEYCLGRGVAALRAKNAKILDGNYLWYWLDANEQALKEKGKGATFLQVTRVDIEELPITLPSLEEQRRIAAILAKADAVRRKRQEALKLVDYLVKSQFIEMFGDPVTNPKGWETKRLGDTVKICSSKRVYQREQSTEGVPFLRVSDLVNRIVEGVETSDLYIPEELYKKFCDKELVPKTGDILVTSRGTLGLCYIVKESDRFYFQDGMISWLNKRGQEINSIYTVYLFQTEYIKQQIVQASAGSTVGYLSLANLDDFAILFPPISLQTQFASFVEQADKSKFAMQRQLDEAESFRSSLMQQFFS